MTTGYANRSFEFQDISPEHSHFTASFGDPTPQNLQLQSIRDTLLPNSLSPVNSYDSYGHPWQFLTPQTSLFPLDASRSFLQPQSFFADFSEQSDRPRRTNDNLTNVSPLFEVNHTQIVQAMPLGDRQNASEARQIMELSERNQELELRVQALQQQVSELNQAQNWDRSKARAEDSPPETETSQTYSCSFEQESSQLLESSTERELVDNSYLEPGTANTMSLQNLNEDGDFLM